ncbi:hypothetical protein ENU1_186100 [Entamoeba nuttalli P19]|uniref:Uncharacterized protein n=1 Tax=Entamoeba nuttalli (strain P19) TaxID=1076696 RepID=K2GVE5_ENTNP|nr:hypothetical protein ENU1_186100 [Entamoeba nuttalli P19]EKE37802.1 hypothetical protein ENU1_186100 [Entamoeba nuttalli P19]|eukprot:XP_008859868.1 hypothetical protein ENU1_186100 [Entamoeba nuttalli P19]
MQQGKRQYNLGALYNTQYNMYLQQSQQQYHHSTFYQQPIQYSGRGYIQQPQFQQSTFNPYLNQHQVAVPLQPSQPKQSLITNFFDDDNFSDFVGQQATQQSQQPILQQKPIKKDTTNDMFAIVSENRQKRLSSQNTVIPSSQNTTLIEPQKDKDSVFDDFGFESEDENENKQSSSKITQNDLIEKPATKPKINYLDLYLSDDFSQNTSVQEHPKPIDTSVNQQQFKPTNTISQPPPKTSSTNQITLHPYPTKPISPNSSHQVTVPQFVNTQTPTDDFDFEEFVEAKPVDDQKTSTEKMSFFNEWNNTSSQEVKKADNTLSSINTNQPKQPQNTVIMFDLIGEESNEESVPASETETTEEKKSKTLMFSSNEEEPKEEPSLVTTKEELEQDNGFVIEDETEETKECKDCGFVLMDVDDVKVQDLRPKENEFIIHTKSNETLKQNDIKNNDKDQDLIEENQGDLPTIIQKESVEPLKEGFVTDSIESLTETKENEVTTKDEIETTKDEIETKGNEVITKDETEIKDYKTITSQDIIKKDDQKKPPKKDYLALFDLEDIKPCTSQQLPLSVQEQNPEAVPLHSPQSSIESQSKDDMNQKTFIKEEKLTPPQRQPTPPSITEVNFDDFGDFTESSLSSEKPLEQPVNQQKDVQKETTDVFSPKPSQSESIPPKVNQTSASPLFDFGDFSSSPAKPNQSSDDIFSFDDFTSIPAQTNQQENTKQEETKVQPINDTNQPIPQQLNSTEQKATENKQKDTFEDEFSDFFVSSQ